MNRERKIKSGRFYTALRRLAIPIALQQMIVSTVNLADVMMLARMGTEVVAGAGLANQVYFLLTVLNYGLYSGMGVFLAQYWGRKDMHHIRSTLGLGLAVGTVASMLFTLAAVLQPVSILSLISSDETALELGTSYLRIAASSYLFTSISTCLGIALRSIGEARIPLFTSVLSLVLNIFFNYILIFGRFGCPALGIEGAALGTCMARTIELAVLVFLIWKHAWFLMSDVRGMLAFDWKFMFHYAKIAVPVIINETLWGLGMVMYVAAYEKAGIDALAVSQVAGTIQNITELVSMGIGNAAAVMIGNVIGEGWPRAAYVYAKKFLFLSLKFGICVGAVLILCIPLILHLVVMPQDVKMMLGWSLVVCAVLVPLKTISVVIIVGILRGGGDTRYAMLVETCNVWLVGVPLAFIGAVVWQLPIYWLMLLINMEEIGKTAWGLYRTYSGRWIRDIT